VQLAVVAAAVRARAGALEAPGSRLFMPSVAMVSHTRPGCAHLRVGQPGAGLVHVARAVHQRHDLRTQASRPAARTAARCRAAAGQVAVLQPADVAAGAVEALAQILDHLQPRLRALLRDLVARGTVGVAEDLGRQVARHLRVVGVEQEHGDAPADAGALADFTASIRSMRRPIDSIGCPAM
jgi:hypothetical protein